MNLEYFRALFNYNYWARDRLLDQVQNLSEAEYIASAPLSHGSIRAALLHTFDTEAFWLARCRGSAELPALDEEQVPTLAELRDRWREIEAELLAFLSNLTESELSQEVRYRGPRSPQEYSNPLWALLSQAAYHSMQHRTEVALCLTGLGYSPGNLDFIIYYTNFKEMPHH